MWIQPGYGHQNRFFILVLTWGIVSVPARPEASEALTATRCFSAAFGLATGLSWLCYFKAMQLGDVSRSRPWTELSVPLAMILAMVFLHEPVSLKVIAGGLLITAGSLLLLF